MTADCRCCVCNKPEPVNGERELCLPEYRVTGGGLFLVNKRLFGLILDSEKNNAQIYHHLSDCIADIVEYQKVFNKPYIWNIEKKEYEHQIVEKFVRVE